MSDPTDLSVIVCVHGGTSGADVASVVASALGQEYDALDVVVVVSGSQLLYDSLSDRFGDASRVTVVHQPVDNGLSAARNYGADAADGDVYAFVDADVVLSDGWATALMTPYLEDGARAVGGPAHPEWEDVDASERLPEEMYWLVGCTERGFEERVRKDGALNRTRNTYGCNISFRSDAFETLGGFDTDYGKDDDLYQAEETVLCERFRRQYGRGIVYVPEAGVDHRVDRRQLAASYLFRRAWWQGRSKAKFSRDYPGATGEEYGFIGVILAGVAREVCGVVREPTLSRLARPLLLVALTAATAFGYGYEFTTA